MAEIQRNIIKQGKRNAISRYFHAKNDKEMIATWRLHLSRILHVFIVCSVTPVWLSLTVQFQAELVINTNVVVSDIHCDVMNTQNTISNIQNGVANTYAIVSGLHHDISGIHHTMTTSQEWTNSKEQSVSVACAFHPSVNAHHHLDPA